jgi:hypothetical protein
MRIGNNESPFRDQARLSLYRAAMYAVTPAEQSRILAELKELPKTQTDLSEEETLGLFEKAFRGAQQRKLLLEEKDKAREN